MSDDYDYDYDTTKTLHAITRPRLRKAKAAVKNLALFWDSYDVSFQIFFSQRILYGHVEYFWKIYWAVAINESIFWWPVPICPP